MNTTTPFPSTLIISRSPGLIVGYLELFLPQIGHKKVTNNPDIFIIDQASGWGIDVIRRTKTFLSRSPSSHSTKLVLIYQSENLNPESQNALLKTIEEPGPTNFFLLFTSRPSTLIPTIISRCQVVKIGQAAISITTKKLLLSQSLTASLSLSSEIAQSSQSVPEFLRHQLTLFHQELIVSPRLSTHNTITKIITALKMINSNVDPQSALDYLLLS